MTRFISNRLKTIPGILVFVLILGVFYARGQDQTRKSIAAVLYETIVNDGMDAALQQYQQIRTTDSTSYNLVETELNGLGYRLINASRVEDAIEIFKLNCKVYPHAFNPWDSMGEAYMIAGQREEAIANYKKSIALNSENVNGKNIFWNIMTRNSMRFPCGTAFT